jgi:ketosteroid isomerase-like protein
MSDADDLRHLLDRLAIQDLYARYTAALNALDFDALDAVFTPDARIDASAFGVPAMAFDEFRPFLAEAFAGFRGHLYVTHDLSVTLRDDDADVRAAFTASVGLDAGGVLHQVTEGGYYVDRLVRTADGWRVADRVEVPAFMWGMPEGSTPPE